MNDIIWVQVATNGIFYSIDILYCYIPVNIFCLFFTVYRGFNLLLDIFSEVYKQKPIPEWV